MQDNKNKKVIGGIVVSKASGIFVFEGSKYDKNTTGKDWQRLKI